MAKCSQVLRCRLIALPLLWLQLLPLLPLCALRGDPTLVHLQTSSPTMSTRKLPIPGKGFTVEPEASKSSTTVTTETIMMSASISLPSSIHTESPTLAGTVSKPVSKEISSEPPSATVIITTRNWSFTVLAQTTAQTMEQSSPTTYGIKPEKQYSVISSISVIIISLIVILVYFICRWYTRRRNPVPEVSVGTEEIPMTGGIDREEDVGS
ncbi:interleukin-15 receptor subunit alpha isoform X3 [Antechinus flavipes]|uniref:interleukin-15 receptor subunit alpha isoform X3 n=1 Tax=Antechinus flavipes TaxID=38775 RepID=UPI00223662BC|nr:interleukin-15 receptor subunit alpha isoform X3 [Antechinus flavipes]